jgi:hypothetical protein
VRECVASSKPQGQLKWRKTGNELVLEMRIARPLPLWVELTALTGACWVGPSRCHAAAGAAQAIVDQRAVYIGEPFTLELRVPGTDQPETPDLSHLRDFTIEPRDGNRYSNESTTTYNGRTTRNSDQGFAFQYQLLARREGRLVIPEIEIKTGAKRVKTQPVSIEVRKPGETPEYKLRLELEKTNCYVGEPVLVSVVLYSAKALTDCAFALPASNSNEFRLFPSGSTSQPPTAVEVTVGNDRVPAEPGEAILDGHRFQTLRFRKAIVPEVAGTVEIPSASVVIPTAPLDTRRPGFPGFGFLPQHVAGSTFGPINPFRPVQRAIVASPPVRLQVLPLPTAGRPPGFNGAVGSYGIQVSAQPTQANVGDPITLAIQVTNPVCVDHLELSALDRDPVLTNDFKVQSEPARGRTSGSEKTFTQIIRPLRSDVSVIPSLQLAYFDPVCREYRAAQSQPIPLHIRETKVVTASAGEAPDSTPPDAIVSGMSRVAQTFCKTLSQLAARVDWARTLGLLLTTSLGCIVVLVAVSYQRRRRTQPADAEAINAAEAFAECMQLLSTIDARSEPDRVLRALRIYLGGRLGLGPSAITFSDVRDLLQSRGVPWEVVERLARLFRTCEAARFGRGWSPPAPPAELESTQKLIAEIEAALSMPAG